MFGQQGDGKSVHDGQEKHPEGDGAIGLKPVSKRSIE
jgi:hypothetical protein